jgi:glycosidase
MPNSVWDPGVTAWTAARQSAARAGGPVTVEIDGQQVQVAPAWASPQDWRDVWIYFLLTDRFNNPSRPPAARWNSKYGKRQGGTFNGVRQQLTHLRRLGARALWLSPVLKNSAPADWEYTYPGYNTQDFLSVDARFASDGKQATAEAELAALVREAHEAGLWVILDIVLNHAGRVFDYDIGGQVRDYVHDPALIHRALGAEPSIEWLNGLGFPRADWTDAVPSSGIGPDDAVWPRELQRKEFWRRRGDRLTDTPPDDGYIPGDFGTMRQLVCEYDASGPGALAVRDAFGATPVLDLLIRCYSHAVARYDFDGLRIDTTKYLRADIVERFGNAMREHALTIGKKNFFVFGEVWETNEWELASFVGRHTPDGQGLGIDAALDFPLQAAIQSVVKGTPQGGVDVLRQLFANRRKAEMGQISSHGEAGRFFVSFLDNHDMHERFRHPLTPVDQVTMALGLLFTLQGIPSIYYGTERGLTGTVADDGTTPALDSFESVREALWGMKDAAGASAGFAEDGPFRVIRDLSTLRGQEEALRYGRLYFRQAAGNGIDFGFPSGGGGLVAYSRVLGDSEVLVVANTNTASPWSGSVVVDLDVQRGVSQLRVRYSNKGTTGLRRVNREPQARFWEGGTASTSASPTAAVDVSLDPMELQILSA